ncbi:PREDICTED: outer envelope protein 64, mitochondrial [Tarenaya hassleriana]|uniref:outer envelope protein 64, mitochondrial n=1 Tax=Tarenaya hassleriana TaxID=28532 RepID=UPI00053C113B|nr:PREDICTED: outer envelope protein 64, mitochondrial [Tarenaya hassleriana]
MSKTLSLIRNNASNPKVWLVIGVTVAGIVILAETRRRRIKTLRLDDFGAFLDRFELLPFPPPPPPAAKQPLSGLTFSVADAFDVKDYITGFGNPQWKKTHGPAEKTAVVVTALLKTGATCVGKTIMDEMGFGITGENKHYGTPVNPKMPSHVPGGCSSGAAVSVAAELVDFALGIDTTGGVRIPASFCGILGFRPSQGTVSSVGVLPNSQSLETVGWFARDPSVLCQVGHALLSLNAVPNRRQRCFIFADDLFELSYIPKQKTVHVIRKGIENLSGYQSPKHMNLGQHVASNIPSLKGFCEQSVNLQNSASTLKVLSSVMLSIQRHEFRTNHEEWFQSCKSYLGPKVSSQVLEALKSRNENIKSLYKVKTEMRAAIQNLLKDDGVLVIPTVADASPKLKTNKKNSLNEFLDRTYALSSIASMSGCCQVTIPLGNHGDHPISVSFLTYHGGDKFLLDTVLDVYASLQDQARIMSTLAPISDSNGSLEASELLKEKGNAAFKMRQWNKAVKFYTEAIKLNGANATYFCNRAAAYLELGCFQQAEEDCTNAILLDKKNVKAYLRRGTARESLIRYKEAAADFKHALVLEPQNKTAKDAEKRLRRLLS